MPKITFFIGLCGSGKTYHSVRLQAETGAQLFEGVVGAQTISEVIRCLRGGNDCIVEEISYCVPEFRAVITRTLCEQVPGVHVEWMCLENDLESANWTVVHRTNKAEVERHMEINGRVSKEYTYADCCTVIPITRCAARQ